MLICKKCTGRVFIDRTYSQGNHVELSCINCGKSWMLSKEKSALARWLSNQELLKDLALNVVN